MLQLHSAEHDFRLMFAELLKNFYISEPETGKVIEIFAFNWNRGLRPFPLTTIKHFLFLLILMRYIGINLKYF